MITLKVKPPDHRDEDLKAIIEAAKAGKDLTVEADSMLLTRVQLAVVKGEIPASVVRIETHHPFVVEMDEDGRMEGWPRNYLMDEHEYTRHILNERRKRNGETPYF